MLASLTGPFPLIEDGEAAMRSRKLVEGPLSIVAQTCVPMIDSFAREVKWPTAPTALTIHEHTHTHPCSLSLSLSVSDTLHSLCSVHQSVLSHQFCSI